MVFIDIKSKEQCGQLLKYSKEEEEKEKRIMSAQLNSNLNINSMNKKATKYILVVGTADTYEYQHIAEPYVSSLIMSKAKTTKRTIQCVNNVWIFLGNAFKIEIKLSST